VLYLYLHIRYIANRTFDGGLNMVIFCGAVWITMDFPERLAKLRKQRALTQKALADKVGIHITQIQRYENGSTQPTLDIIRKLATTLAVSADELIFGEGARGPDERLRLQFEAICQLDPQERQVVTELLDGMIIKYQSRRWDTSRDQMAGQ
jgi:transcriptional regulator with XRE-family HTH domain